MISTRWPTLLLLMAIIATYVVLVGQIRWANLQGVAVAVPSWRFAHWPDTPEL